jgi:hypothetical protein
MLEALGAFTGHFWSDTLALEPFICEAITNYMNQIQHRARSVRGPVRDRNAIGVNQYQWAISAPAALHSALHRCCRR